MSKWGRDTRWRQGHLLPVEAINAFGLAGDRAAEDCAAVVISHDCDLAQPSDAEPYVEIIVGRFVAAIDGNFANCKNPRRLHLEVSGGPAKRVVELEAAKRFNLPKELEDKSARTMLEFLPHEGVVPSEL